MAQIKSRTRTISNRGPRPKFIGLIPCTKPMRPPKFGSVPTNAFDSVSSMLGAVWLEWRADIAKMDFESEVDMFEEDGDLPQMRAITDYHVVMDTGELGRVEIKYSLSNLSSEELERLSQLAEHHKREGLRSEVMDRITLEKEGFIHTVLLLRPYAAMHFSRRSVDSALHRLKAYPEERLSVWRARAREHRVPVALLYKLLYDKRLPLRYQPLSVAELQPCLA